MRQPVAKLLTGRLGQHPRREPLGGFEKGGIVEQVERLQSRVRSRAPRSCRQGVRRVEIHQHRIGRGSLEMNIDPAAIAFRANAHDPVFLGVPQLGYARGLGWKDTLPANFRIQQSTHLQRVVANQLGGQAEAILASQQLVARILFLHVGPRARRLPVGR